MPKTRINQLNQYFFFEIVFLNSALYNQGGRTNPIIPAPNDPAIFKKSVKLGMRRAIPVTRQIMTDRAATDLAFLVLLEPILNQEPCSRMSKAHRI